MPGDGATGGRGDHDGSGGRRGGGLPEVDAARERARAVRRGIYNWLLGTVFLLGALLHAYAPPPSPPSSAAWMAFLVVLSSFHVGMGLRIFSIARGRGRRLWLPAALLWGLLATILLRILSRR